MDAKTRGIVSYITIFGWLIAFFTKTEGRDDFEVFHLRQAFGTILLGFIPFIGLIALVFMIIGAINASKGEKKHLPFVGEFFEKTFSFIQ